ncbi:MAG: alpha/beta hydrolase [Ktedonobacteraceae bacterium]|nr:alpha/beta hydrolase [Ktedonobacteraceae bacterium]
MFTYPPSPILPARLWESSGFCEKRPVSPRQGKVSRWVLPLALLMVLPLLLASGGPGVTDPTSTSFQWTETCPFKVGEGITVGREVSCGILTVPENRSRPTGRSIQLAVALFKTSEASDTIPIIRLEGGPGGSALKIFGEQITKKNLSQTLLSHNWILVDQRGTGYSKPSLTCPEIRQARDATADASDQEQEKAQARAIQNCHRRLTEQGIDLSAYNSLENAADIHDLIQALGYPQVTLYGDSYGSRLALTTMRIAPQGIRSVILDGVYPPQVEYSINASQAIETLLYKCVTNMTCKQKYPNLVQEYGETVNMLNEKPLRFEMKSEATGKIIRHRVTGNDFSAVVFQLLYSTPLIPYLPALIHQTRKGDNQLLVALFRLIDTVPETIDWGMFYSVECSERFSDPCPTWKVPKVPAEQKSPVVSSIPTLLLTGEYDPITPQQDAEAAARTLSKSYEFVLPGAGHVVLGTSLCANQIITSFVDDPTRNPTASCLNQLGEPAFV